MAGGRRSTTGNQHALARTQRTQQKTETQVRTKWLVRSLDQIRNELTTNSLAIAKCIQDITDRIDSISCILMDSNVKQGHTWDQWKGVKTDFSRLVADVREIANEGMLQIQNILETVSTCLNSKGSAEDKQKEFMSLKNELNEFINRTNSLSRKLTDTYKAIVRYTNGWPHGNTVYSQEIQPRLSFIVTNVGLLIERDISVDADLKLKLDQSVVGIVKALVVFLSSKVYQKLVSFAEDENAPRAYPEHFNSGKGVKINVHVLDNLINVGKLLAEDIEDMQSQPDAFSYVKKFDLMHDLYGCLGDVLGKFSVACAVRQGSGRPLFELCGKNTTASTMASDLPSNQYEAEKGALHSGRADNRTRNPVTGGRSNGTGIVGMFRRLLRLGT